MKFILSAFAALLLVSSVPAQAEVVATVAGEPISMEELETALRPQLIEIDNQRFEVLQNGLYGVIAEKLMLTEATALDLTQDELEAKEISGKVTDPTEEEINALYEENKAQLGEATIEEVKPRIEAYLRNQNMGERAQAYLAELREKYEVVVKLAAPTVEVANGAHSARGGADAKVVIVGFSDYECPYCKRGEQVAEQVMEVYGDQVQYYHRDFPLAFHANAKPAAEAAHCADAQGKFWEFHAKLFSGGALNLDAYNSYADQLSLDRAAFDECVSSGKFGDTVDKDQADGAVAGVSGTPAFFINGRVLSGAQPFERFEQVIDDELTKAGVTIVKNKPEPKPAKPTKAEKKAEKKAKKNAE